MRGARIVAALDAHDGVGQRERHTVGSGMAGDDRLDALGAGRSSERAAGAGLGLVSFNLGGFGLSGTGRGLRLGSLGLDILALAFSSLGAGDLGVTNEQRSGVRFRVDEILGQSNPGEANQARSRKTTTDISHVEFEPH